MEPVNFLEHRDLLFEKTSIKCEVHDINLVRKKHGKAFCPKCSVVNVAHAEADMMNDETQKVYKRLQRQKEYEKDENWLKRESIVTDKNMLNMTFDNYKTTDKETTDNKEKSLEIARSYFKGNKKNAIFTGNFGTGKTHLAMAILNEINKHSNKKLMFVAMDELMRRIKSSFGNKDSMYQEDRMVDMLIEAEILVLDDIGAEIGSVSRKSQAGDYTVQVLNGILNGRTNKSTIFTTNLTKGDMLNIYDGRIVSRMMRGVTAESAVQFTKTSDKRMQIDF